MKSLYALLRERCGLSIREAAEFHSVPVNTVTKWSSGDRNPPPGVIAELRELYERIEAAADELIQAAEEAGPEVEIEIGLASDDYEAQSIGWPCVGAHAAAIGLAAIYVDNPVIVVPRGSTVITAAAADTHDNMLRRRK